MLLPVYADPLYRFSTLSAVLDDKALYLAG